jgi:hypothetical protein
MSVTAFFTYASRGKFVFDLNRLEPRGHPGLAARPILARRNRRLIWYSFDEHLFL